jgi:hypothetical protein
MTKRFVSYKKITSAIEYMLVHLLIFIVILFLYLHITDQYKKGENMEVYEMDYIDNPQLQDVCNIKQPIVFDAPSPNEFFEKMRNTLSVHYGSYEVRVKDLEDYQKETVDSIVLPLESTQNLFTTDTEGHYFSEDNATFLEETGLSVVYRSLDGFLRPPFTVATNEDVWFGSKKCWTPLRYHTNYRRFLCVVSPWKSSKYLNPVKDYEHYDFRSTYNPWSSQSDSPLQFLEAEACAGQIVYIPPYWWYSIQYVADEPTYVCVETYHSLMNWVAHGPDLAFYVLQNQNITKTYAKKVTFAEPISSDQPSDSSPPSEKEATIQLTEELTS